MVQWQTTQTDRLPHRAVFARVVLSAVSIEPGEVTQQATAFAPDEPPKIAKCDLVGFQTRIGFDTPAEIRRFPRPQAISRGRNPQEAEHAT